jgi:hypothetical protein
MTLGNAAGAAYWITERENIRKKKEAGHARPWTKDPILAAYRFCNVRRADDKVTRWIWKWATPYQKDELLARYLTLARLVNWPPTIKSFGTLRGWEPDRLIAAINKAEQRGKAWSSAYIVSTNGRPISKALHVVKDVAGGVPAMGGLREGGDSLQAVWARLQGCYGLGSFMAAQVVADLKNMDCWVADAEDWWTWAAPGPGSKRGIRRYFGGSGMPASKDFLGALHIMIEEVRPHIDPNLAEEMCAQDWQNVCCELDKYWRTKANEGRPKAFYSPSPDFS